MLYYIKDFFIKLILLISIVLLWCVTIFLCTKISRFFNLENYIGSDNDSMIIGISSMVLTYLVLKGISAFFVKMKQQQD